MTQTLLFEHETTKFAWTDRDLAALERLRRAVGIEVLRATVRGGERVVQTAQHVGVLRLGNHTIQVLPKIYQSSEAAEEKQRAREATRNLLYLLEYAGQLPIREHDFASLLRRDMDWFEILTRLFASHLMDEWQRGVIRGYVVVEEELPLLKGKWRIAEQLRRPERKHVFAVAYDEFTADNPLNRVFRFVVERLWHLTRDSGNRQLLGELRQWMEEVSLPPSVRVSDADPARLLTRLNQRYLPLLNLARLFLDGGALRLTAGDLTTFAFVFDMNELFEKFIVNFIRRHWNEIRKGTPYAGGNYDLLPQSRGAPHYLAKRDSKDVFHLKPDLAFRDGDRFPLLLDAKYKLLDTETRRLGVAPDDFYQMFAYAHRYDCPRVLLVYPQTAGMDGPLRASFKIEKTEKVVEMGTVDLRSELGRTSGQQALTSNLKTIVKGGECS